LQKDGFRYPVDNDTISMAVLLTECTKVRSLWSGGVTTAKLAEEGQFNITTPV
jgi:hypothetical protein